MKRTSTELVSHGEKSPSSNSVQTCSQTSDSRLSGIPDDGLHHLWRQVERMRDMTVKIGTEVLEELLQRRNTIARLGQAIQVTDPGDDYFVKSENSDSEQEAKPSQSTKTPRRLSYGSEHKNIEAKRDDIIANINTLAEVQAIAHQFDTNMIPSASLDLRTHVEKTLASFEVKLLEIEKQIELSRQEILENTTQRAATIRSTIHRQVADYIPFYESRRCESEERLEVIFQKKRELLDRLEQCCHGSPTIQRIEQKIRSLTEEESAIRAFLNEDDEQHRTVLHYSNWMYKFTKPDNIPKCLQKAFERTGRSLHSEIK